MFDNKLVKCFRTLKTPFFYYDLELLERTIRNIADAGFSRGYRVHYALKANNNPKILHRLREAGFGADCVSGGEIGRALEAGFAPGQIAFAGVGKSDEEIEVGLKHEIFSFNCESAEEIEVLDQMASQRGKVARVALRINPNVKANTHKYITTGLNENKFGILSEDLPGLLDRIDSFKGIRLTGMHFHIGSQILDLNAYRTLCERINELQSLFSDRELNIRHINVGGGLGIDYSAPDRNGVPDFKSYFSTFETHLKLRKGQEVHFELGRSVVGQCGSLITKVLFTKQGRATRFAIVDAGMTELIRPALYEAQHSIDALTSNREYQTYDVVGPICETSDTFRRNIPLPEVRRGDLLAIRSCGAYGQVMSSYYNLRERAAAYYSDEFKAE
ncbi:MAG: diaminopimelate decarboxylase [Balneolaceae bacterium]